MAYKFTSGSFKTTGPVSGSGTLYSAGAATMSSTLAVSGTVTAVGDLVVGDDLSLNSDAAVLNIGADDDLKITHDGTNGDFESAGNLTFDVGGDITLDADGDQVTMKFGGLAGQIDFSAANTGDGIIRQMVDNKDLVIQQFDGTEVARFTDAGSVEVKDNLSLTSDSAVFNMGVGNDFTITHDGTTGATIAGNPIVIDSAGDLTLDAEGADILLKDGGVTFGSLTNASTDFVISSSVNDKDILFKGVDGNSQITALTLDMSAAGAAAFNSTVTATGFTIGSAVIGEAELELLDGVSTAGTVYADKVVTVDSNKDVSSFRSVTGSGDALFANIHATAKFYGDGSGLTGVTVGGETVRTAIVDENKTLATGLNFGLHTLTAVRNWTLPANPSQGDKIIVKAPTGSDWNAALNYVNLTAAGAQIIDGVTSHRLNSVGASVTCICVVAGVSGVWALV